MPRPLVQGRDSATHATTRVTIDHALRLRHLWLAYLLGMLFHVELGLMPLFHGVSASIESQVPTNRLGLVFWGMLLYFLIPLAALLLIAYADSQPRSWRRWRSLHCGLSLVYSLTNLAHLLADILIPDSRSDQVFLMLVLLGLGLLINREAWLWWRSAR